MNNHFQASVRLAAGLLLSGAYACSAYAGDADGQRDISIYDQNPACLERGELKPGQPSPCVLPSSPSGRSAIVRAPASGNSTSSTAGVAPGAQPGVRRGAAEAVMRSPSGAAGGGRAMR
jgi:hypothetical protein